MKNGKKTHERKISDSYKSLNGKWSEKNQRVINNPVTQEKSYYHGFFGHKKIER